jgi:hypothetical protein
MGRHDWGWLGAAIGFEEGVPDLVGAQDIGGPDAGIHTSADKLQGQVVFISLHGGWDCDEMESAYEEQAAEQQDACIPEKHPGENISSFQEPV